MKARDRASRRGLKKNPPTLGVAGGYSHQGVAARIRDTLTHHIADRLKSGYCLSLLACVASRMRVHFLCGRRRRKPL